MGLLDKDKGKRDNDELDVFWRAVAELVTNDGRDVNAELLNRDGYELVIREHDLPGDAIVVQAKARAGILAELRRVVADRKALEAVGDEDAQAAAQTARAMVEEDTDTVSRETPDLEAVDRVLKANGYAAIRAQVAAAVNAAAAVPVEAIDAALAYLDGQRGGNGREPLPAHVTDNMDLDKWNLEALREFRLELDNIARRSAARQELRRR